MREEIAVNTGNLNSDIDEIQTQLNTIKNDLKKMYDAVQTLDSMWDGPANEAFKAQFKQDHKDMTRLCRTIQNLVDCMNFAKKEYNICENEIKEIIASIQV